MKSMPLVLSICCALSGPALVCAQRPITIADAWARESPPSTTNGAVYMTLLNQGQATDRLVSAAGEVSETIELHTVRMEESMMKMRRIDAIPVVPGIPTMLKPGGFHIMLLGLKQPLVAGRTFPLRLRFEQAGEITVDVSVRTPDGQRPSGTTHGEKHH